MPPLVRILRKMLKSFRVAAMRLLWVLTLLILIALVFVDGKRRLYVASEAFNTFSKYWKYRGNTEEAVRAVAAAAAEVAAGAGD